jgi:hypothetical protein
MLEATEHPAASTINTPKHDTTVHQIIDSGTTFGGLVLAGPTKISRPRIK